MGKDFFISLEPFDDSFLILAVIPTSSLVFISNIADWAFLISFVPTTSSYRNGHAVCWSLFHGCLDSNRCTDVPLPFVIPQWPHSQQDSSVFLQNWLFGFSGLSSITERYARFSSVQNFLENKGTTIFWELLRLLTELQSTGNHAVVI